MLRVKEKSERFNIDNNKK